MIEAGIPGVKVEPPKYPEVDPYPDTIWAYNAFWRLSGRRPIGMDGPLRIPLSEVVAWCDLSGYAREKGLEFTRYVDAMDIAYMDFMRERREEEEGKRRQAAQGSRGQTKGRAPPPISKMPRGARPRGEGVHG